jgi:hypothetical protein
LGTGEFVSYDSQNKEGLFPQTALRDWSFVMAKGVEIALSAYRLDYWLDCRELWVLSLAAARDHSLSIQAGSGAHPVSCKIDSDGCFPEDKGAGAFSTTLEENKEHNFGNA